MHFKKLGDYAKVQGGYAYKSKDFADIGIPVLKIKNVGKGSLLYNEVSYVDESFLDTTSNFVTQEGDVLISMTGSNINQPASMVGRVARVSKDDPLSLINQRVGRILLKEEGVVDIRFLYYYLSQYEVQYYLVSNATGSANQVNINGKLIESIEIPDYDYNTTKKIAHILSTLDDKIELNRKMNQTLEEMAQTLFKSWFVDFDPVHAKATAKTEAELDQAAKTLGISREVLDLFPSKFVESEMGVVPLGWEVSTIDAVTSRIIDHRGKTPKKLGGDWSDIGHPAISAKNIKRGRIVKHDTIRFLNNEIYSKWMKHELAVGDIILTSEAPMGEMYLLTDDTKYCLSQRLYALRADSKKVTPSYLYQWLQISIAQADLEGRSTGTTVVGIKQVELRKVSVLLACTDLITEFEKLAFPLLRQIHKNENLNISLQQTRDTLLPKPLSGELDVSNISLNTKEEKCH